MELKSYRPRRAALYVPSNNIRALNKASSLDVDVIIYDLEDAVLTVQKPQARLDLAQHLSTTRQSAEVVVRINGTKTSAFYEDLDWLKQVKNIDAVLLPKVRDANELENAKKMLKQVNISKPIWLLIETVDAVLNLGEIVKLVEKNAALVLGAEDLAKEMRISHTPGRLGLLPILTQLILHGRSSKLTVLDAIFPNLDNELGFRQSCEQAKNLGFDGKTVIHPKQIDIANQAFSPTPEQIERATKIVESWNDRNDTHGVVLVDGDVIELLHVEQALELLSLAKYYP